MILDQLSIPIVLARLTAAVSNAGGLGFVAAGYLTASSLAERPAQLGMAFMCCPEAGTAKVDRQALAGTEPTAMTRAFTGRLARGIRNRFLDRHSVDAPAACPEVHYLTAPLRARGRAMGDLGLINLWAGQAYQLGREIPVGQLVRRLADQARAASLRATQRLSATADDSSPVLLWLPPEDRR